MTELFELNLAFQRLLSDDPEAEEQKKIDLDDDELDDDEDEEDDDEEEGDNDEEEAVAEE